MKKTLTCLLAVIILTFAGCGRDVATADSVSSNLPEETQPFQVVATIFPQYDWMRQILGDQANNVELTLLLDNGVDLHSYQPTADDMIKISTCDMFVYVGGESDGWVHDALAEATNPNMVVVNLLDVLGDTVKQEEIVEGMEHEHAHSHGVTTFEDDEVQDRTLADWEGDWQSVYPYLLDGTLDEVMEHKAEENDTMTAEEYHAYYDTGYKTDVERIVIEGDTFTFYQSGTAVSGDYEYKGYEILTYESGNKGVRYLFETIEDTDAPRYLQFSDHCIEPTDAEHYHLYWGDESFDALLTEMDYWPTYYSSDFSAEEIVDDMLGHEEEHELDEHVWLSLKNAQIICTELSEKLCMLDPAHADTYQANTEAYLSALGTLDNAYQTAVDASSVKTLLFADRFPFRYLVDDYALAYYAAFSGCSAETEASFETIVFLAEKMNELNLSHIFVIESSDQSIANTVMQSTANKNQTILVLDSIQSVTASDISSGTSYLSIMEDNLAVLKTALQ